MFRDRQHAGELLAAELVSYSRRARTLLLALPRGGVPVATAAARELDLPLDIFPVRKLGAPGQPEYAMGAITADGLPVLNEAAIESLRVSEADIEAIAAREREELLRRERLYRGDRPPVQLAGETVILVDDGLATGYTMLAAIRAVRRQAPEAIVIAVPVAAAETLEWLRPEVDALFCVYVPAALVAVGEFYRDFRQTTDDEVREALRRSEERSRSSAFGER